MSRLTLVAAIALLSTLVLPTASADGIWDHLPGGQPPNPVAEVRDLAGDLGLDPSRSRNCVSADAPGGDPGQEPHVDMEDDDQGNPTIKVVTGVLVLHIVISTDCLGSVGPRPQSDDGLPG